MCACTRACVRAVGGGTELFLSQRSWHVKDPEPHAATRRPGPHPGYGSDLLCVPENVTPALWECGSCLRYKNLRPDNP